MASRIDGVPIEEACRRCGSFCCTYYALPLDDPEDKDDFDDLRWFLMHGSNYIYIEDDDWYLNIASPCKNLGSDGLCKAYDKRPRICREHGNGEDPCEFYSDYQYEYTFCEPIEIEKYAIEELELEREEVPHWYVYDDESFWRKIKRKTRRSAG